MFKHIDNGEVLIPSKSGKFRNVSKKPEGYKAPSLNPFKVREVPELKAAP